MMIKWALTQENRSSGGMRTTKAQTSAFVTCVLESIISKLATGEISIFKQVPVAEETGLSLALLETPKTDFVLAQIL